MPRASVVTWILVEKRLLNRLKALRWFDFFGAHADAGSLPHAYALPGGGVGASPAALATGASRIALRVPRTCAHPVF